MGPGISTKYSKQVLKTGAYSIDCTAYSRIRGSYVSIGQHHSQCRRSSQQYL